MALVVYYTWRQSRTAKDGAVSYSRSMNCLRKCMAASVM